ncbi:MAG: type IV toxin-antitoxin system AbiEi family antitoxin domain-containing protein [Roseburia sp.]|uniref:type IV toxin-antitoxin system AbiEi family antitoxin domain-containing protein n=1 Tax=Roseburia sp. 831b TaxID=1261635 RepID=UPI00156B542A|nr:type IV toxin-antitoxin system AbiEi family antitoxin domain-containing protein [Roseburia sp. 831b]MCI5917924.1 type IV toxin-antitoxin system AbiEi family antitoxin domain-containing protein [Roseburia sp.]MDD6217308.1 type IV toxin-antitoxin system AbiEi family antitoxin domain-containing protein [Roseburia sp.]WVK72613.1 type IV toxin-antitoxin system AbiEi family antitoxin domain-containing protein [Roseburia sp. 831b]
MNTTNGEMEKPDVTLDKIKTFIRQKGGIIKKEQIKELGVDYRKILSYVEKGELIRVKNGYYAVTFDDFSEEELIAMLFPDGVLCLESALFFYGYTSKKPYGWKIAVDKNTSKSRFKLDYPQVTPFYTEPEVLQLGVTTIKLGDKKMKIYERERLVCDCLKYEDKMDREIWKEGLLSYIQDTDKDVEKLMRYARERKVLKKVQTMIGVWL